MQVRRVELTPVGLADGTYTLTAAATDLAGNTGSIALGFTLDTVAPVLTAALVSDTGASAIDRITAKAALTPARRMRTARSLSAMARPVLGTTTAGAGGAWNFHARRASPMAFTP